MSLAREGTEEYDRSVMIHWRTFARMALSIVLLASLTLVLVHWHTAIRGQDCGICTVQHIPALPGADELRLAVPLQFVRVDRSEYASRVCSCQLTGLHGRAPPCVFSSI